MTDKVMKSSTVQTWKKSFERCCHRFFLRTNQEKSYSNDCTATLPAWVAGTGRLKEQHLSPHETEKLSNPSDCWRKCHCVEILPHQVCRPHLTRRSKIPLGSKMMALLAQSVQASFDLCNKKLHPAQNDSAPSGWDVAAVQVNQQLLSTNWGPETAAVAKLSLKLEPFCSMPCDIWFLGALAEALFPPCPPLSLVIKSIQAALYFHSCSKSAPKATVRVRVFEFLNSLVSTAAFPSLQVKISRLREKKLNHITTCFAVPDSLSFPSRRVPNYPNQLTFRLSRLGSGPSINVYDPVVVNLWKHPLQEQLYMCKVNSGHIMFLQQYTYICTDMHSIAISCIYMTYRHLDVYLCSYIRIYIRIL